LIARWEQDVNGTIATSVAYVLMSLNVQRAWKIFDVVQVALWAGSTRTRCSRRAEQINMAAIGRSDKRDLTLKALPAH